MGIEPKGLKTKYNFYYCRYSYVSLAAISSKD